MPPDRDAGALVEARGVVVRHGARLALDGIDLAVRAGEIVTLVGPNGSGKTTLVRVMLGLVRPCAGTFASVYIHTCSTSTATAARPRRPSKAARRGREVRAIAYNGRV